MSQLAVETRPPTEGDIDALVAGMRRQDVAEVQAAGHTDLRAAVADGVRRSHWCLTAAIGGEVVCIFGVAPLGSLLDNRGVPWMLGTDLVPRNRRALARLAPGYIRRMLQTYPHLVNVVHARNTVAVGWLKRVGFHLHPAQPRGPHGEPFHVFEVRGV
jgi:hypothetical protein